MSPAGLAQESTVAVTRASSRWTEPQSSLRALGGIATVLHTAAGSQRSVASCRSLSTPDKWWGDIAGRGLSEALAPVVMIDMKARHCLAWRGQEWNEGYC